MGRRDTRPTGRTGEMHDDEAGTPGTAMPNQRALGALALAVQRARAGAGPSGTSGGTAGAAGEVAHPAADPPTPERRLIARSGGPRRSTDRPARPEVAARNEVAIRPEVTVRRGVPPGTPDSNPTTRLAPDPNVGPVVSPPHEDGAVARTATTAVPVVGRVDDDAGLPAPTRHDVHATTALPAITSTYAAMHDDTRGTPPAGPHRTPIRAEGIAPRGRGLVAAVIVLAAVVAAAAAALGTALATGGGSPAPTAAHGAAGHGASSVRAATGRHRTTSPTTTPTPSGATHPATTTPAGTRGSSSPGAGTTGPGASGGAAGSTPAPVVTGLTPSSGLPGQTLAVTGSNFLSASGLITAHFGAAAASIRCPSQSSCTVTVPAAPAGGPPSVPVTVTTDTGTSRPVSFHYA